MVVASSTNPFTMVGYSGSIVDNNACTTTPYRDFTSTMSCMVLPGGKYNCRLGNNTNNYMMSSQIWIDFNNDGSFATSESVGGGQYRAVTTTKQITIPSTVLQVRIGCV